MSPLQLESNHDGINFVLCCCCFLCIFELVQGFENLPFNESDATAPSLIETAKTFAYSTKSVKDTLLFTAANGIPYVASERRAFMGWNDSFLEEIYRKSSSNRGQFYKELKTRFKAKKDEEFGRFAAPSGNASDTIESEQEEADARSKANQTVGMYLRPPHMTQAKINKFLQEQNNARTNAEPTADEMLKLSWDYDLEASAWQRLELCNFHAGKSAPGENSWVGWGVEQNAFDPSDPVQDWLQEKKYFHQNLRTCIGGPCERYVQMMWYDAYKAGCAWKTCQGMKIHGYELKQAAVFAVCHYGPRGMTSPMVPYYVGPPCIFCDEEDYCKDKLCANTQRDKITGGKPWPTTKPQLPTTSTSAVQYSVSYEVRVTLPIVAGLVGTTLLVTIAIAVAVKRLRRRILEHNLNVEESFPKWFLPLIYCCLGTKGSESEPHFHGISRNDHDMPPHLLVHDHHSAKHDEGNSVKRDESKSNASYDFR